MFRIRALSEYPEKAIALAAEHSPYLARLAASESDVSNPDLLLQRAHEICDEVAAAGEDPFARLRHAKKIAHLAIAANDLSGRSDLSRTTRCITDFADAAVNAALQVSLNELGLTEHGLFVVALGKMGAFELNYSSDIDISAFFDPDIFDGGRMEPAEAASRVIQRMSRILSDRTPDGYVFRTDLRLRPDPSSTPVAVSTRRAELYYESVGQNWERMVWIKARTCAGDAQSADRFYQVMEPFIWRRHLDYWAIADVHAIKDMINVKAGEKTLNDPAADLKLGPGGIREIEFFVQTQQIIFGGRNPAMRVRGTLEALEQLVEHGVVTADVSTDLATAYDTLRAVEHRVQMLDDEQTHSLPAFEIKRTKVAALCGAYDLGDFDAQMIALRQQVHSHYRNLFADEARKKERAVEGNLVFTGVDDDPETVKTLARIGFGNPPQIVDRIRQWHRGRTPATRTLRGRELLTALLPDLLAAMGETGEADEAFRRFGRFFEGLRSGVQVLAMLLSSADLMKDLVTTLAIAPRIADILARRPGLLEALIATAERKPQPIISAQQDFETQINLMRRWQGEQAFLIGHQLLHGHMKARDAASAWTALADSCIELMAHAALHETERRFGPAPGAWSIVGLGKLGGREMTAGSDLDLIVIYEASSGSDAQAWFTRFTQRLITALSAETGEGLLYEVDMRLRPSGRSGPVATSLPAFETYHQTNAWTWEHMALTRLRPIVGDIGLGEKLCGIAERVINSGESATRTADILDMRNRLRREKPPAGQWDLKMRPGGLVDLEFVTQHAILTADTHQALMPELTRSHAQLFETGVWSAETYESVSRAFAFLQALQQIQRIAHAEDVESDTLSNAMKDRLCRATGLADFNAVLAELERVCDDVSRTFFTKIGELATEF